MRTQLKRQDAVSLAAKLAMQFPGDEQVIESLSLAAFAHDGAFRKETRGGAEYLDPYIIHPLRNALRVQRWYAGWHYPSYPTWCALRFCTTRLKMRPSASSSSTGTPSSCTGILPARPR